MSVIKAEVTACVAEILYIAERLEQLPGNVSGHSISMVQD